MVWRRQHCGCMAAVFGAGVLIGMWLESALVSGCLGVGFIALGVWILLKK